MVLRAMRGRAAGAAAELAAGPVPLPYNRRAMLRAVIFDAGHTLLRMNYAALTAALRVHGHSVSEAAVTDAERRARVRVDEERAAQASREASAGGRYLRYQLDELGITDEAQRRAIAEWRRGYNLPVGLCHCADPEALDALRRVRAAGLATGVISNSNGSARHALEAAGLAGHLDFVVDSTVVGVAKPDPRAFQLGLAEARVAAADAVYVGDSYVVDVVGARRVGMGAVLFDPGGHWGARDCPTARGLGEAVALALA